LTRKLNLDGNAFGEGGVRALAEAVADNRSLTRLSLAYNDFADLLTVRLVARAILLNESLIDVNIDGNSIVRLQLTANSPQPSLGFNYLIWIFRCEYRISPACPDSFMFTFIF
jgi:hypothetical protein